MAYYFIKPITTKNVKGCEFLSFVRDLLKKYKKKLLNKELDSLKTPFTNVVQTTDECLGNRIADQYLIFYDSKIGKTKPVIDDNSGNVRETIIPPEKRGSVKRIKISIIKMEHYKIFKLLNNLTLSKFATKNESK